MSDNLQTATDNLSMILGLSDAMEALCHEDYESPDGTTTYYSLASSIKKLAKEGLDAVVEVKL